MVTAGPYGGCFVACSRYSTKDLPDWFLIEYSGPKCEATLSDEIDFNDESELDAYCKQWGIRWLNAQEMQEELRTWFPAHFRRPSALERFFERFWNGRKF